MDNKNFIYLNSNKSGVGDRLTDLILITAYSLYLKCQNIFLHWTEDKRDMVGNKSEYSILRGKKTPFRAEDYLLKNLKKYIILPKNIHFIPLKDLILMSNDKNNIVFKEYTGMKYTLFSFMKHINLLQEEKENFEKIYFSLFQKVKFQNIPNKIVNYFKNNNVISVHLRRGDKVCNDNGKTNNIDTSQLTNLNNLTIKCINTLIKMNYKYFYFVSDEKKVRDYYVNLFKNKANCIAFDGNSISQTYYDIYSLANSEKIILSQVFSVFSIFSSLIRNNELYYLMKHRKMEKFSEYKNINSFHGKILFNRKIFRKDLLIHKFSKDEYPFERLTKNCYIKYFNTQVELENIHHLLKSNLINYQDKEYFNEITKFGKTDRKSVFNSIFYNYYDNNDEFKNLYIKFIKDFIKPIFFPHENYLVVQKTPNIRQHLPGTTTIGKLPSDHNSDFIGIHKDGDFGHSKEEYNFILPVTKMFETNSIYFEEYPNSKIDYEKYLNVNQDIGELGCYYFNQCYHYNKINITGKTRVSFDFRIIPFSKYFETNNLSETSKSKLIIGDYFIKI